jgi:hypothetical protein
MIKNESMALLYVYFFLKLAYINDTKEFYYDISINAYGVL